MQAFANLNHHHLYYPKSEAVSLEPVLREQRLAPYDGLQTYDISRTYDGLQTQLGSSGGSRSNITTLPRLPDLSDLRNLAIGTPKLPSPPPLPPPPMQPATPSSVGDQMSRLIKMFAADQSGFELEDLKGCYIEFSKDQHGSRFLQKELEIVDSDMIQLVFDEVITVIRNLMIDVYGNYVVQKFFDFGTDEHRAVLASKLQGNVVPFSLHLYGCRVVQKALETLPSHLQANIIVELQESTLECIKDQHGNHVIQKCFTSVPTNLMQLLIDPVLESSFEVATHPFGCRVVQRMLENCSEVQVEQILTELFRFTDLLIQHQYGNYIIQHVLENGKSYYKSRVINSIRGKVFMYALQKHASNVLEKCLIHGSQMEVAGIIEELCEQDSNILPLMKDQYGNYVVQKALDISTPSQKRLLIYKIVPHLSTAHKYMYAKHIISKVERYLTRSK